MALMGLVLRTGATGQTELRKDGVLRSSHSLGLLAINVLLAQVLTLNL
jgi:hypothetical protein